jgi:gluconolactonase
MTDAIQLSLIQRAGLFLVIPIALGCGTTLQASEDIVPPGSKVELVVRVEPVEATPFTEGPTHHADGYLYFSDVSNSRILRVNLKAKPTVAGSLLEVFRESSGRANGLAFDREGRLLACEGAGNGGNRRVTRTDKDGKITILAEVFEGKRLNSPNDLTVDARGRIYFTDPRYGDRSGMELDKESVYRIDAPGKITRIIDDVQRPNGIAVSPDQKNLYVVDNNPDKGGARKVYAYALRADGSIGQRRVIHDFGTGRGGDGMCLDNKGNLYLSAGLNQSSSPSQDISVKAGIHIFSRQGKTLGFIPVGEDSVTNCTFGDSNLKTLYITASTGLWRIRLNATGLSFPGVKK